MKRSALIVIAMLIVIAGAGQAFAHHSFTAAYESGKRVEIEGVVKEFVWRNPHSFVRIEVMKDGKPEVWNLEHPEIIRRVRKAMDLRPRAMIERLQLLNPARIQYLQTAKNGHFGNASFPWEQTDLAEKLA